MSLINFQIEAIMSSANLSLSKEDMIYGGYLSICDLVSGNKNQFSIGNIPLQEQDNYFTSSFEQAYRLAVNTDHISANESCDIKNGQGSGAIRGCAGIYSFFGGLHHDDFNEAVALMCFFLFEDISNEETPASVKEYFDSCAIDISMRNKWIKPLINNDHTLATRPLEY